MQEATYSFVVEKFMEYCRIASQSDPARNSTVPSTPQQFEIAELVAKDLRDLGAQDVRVTENAYVFASWPASEGRESAPTLGLCCHLDTAWQANGDPVRPTVHRYEGGELHIGNGVVLSPEVNPELNHMIGWDLITTDGTSILGADDKAGVAEVVALLKRLKEDPSLEHPRLAIAFVPDEEIAHGAALLDVEEFGARWAYTIDGGGLGEFGYECFNACGVTIRAQGVSVHTGTAKGVLINAAESIMQFNAMLPPLERPEYTEGYEGFYYLSGVRGDCVSARAEYIIRDHDAQKFQERIETMRKAVQDFNAQRGSEVLSIEVTQQYRNMAEIITLPQNQLIVDHARSAFAAQGVEMMALPIRGGTDGAQLSFRGLPCANLSAGYYNAHGYMEFSPIPELETMVDVLVTLVGLYAGEEG